MSMSFLVVHASFGLSSDRQSFSHLTDQPLLVFAPLTDTKDYCTSTIFATWLIYLLESKQCFAKVLIRVSTAKISPALRSVYVEKNHLIEYQIRSLNLHFGQTRARLQTWAFAGCHFEAGSKTAAC